jgi:DMSO/TMAO reductase YedYZ molybdopterin-dependent catalytic subunit
MTATTDEPRPTGVRGLLERGPGGPFDEHSWRSPIRGPWLTSVLALVLLVGLLVMITTGLLSYAAYDPALGGSNDQTPQAGVLARYIWFDWFTSPSWLYRLNQGTHVLLGLALIPVVLGKLWSVAPKLFEWPPVKSPAQALERLSILLIVGSVLFQMVTGIMNIQHDYAWGFSFYTGHFFGAWVFIAAFAAHVALKTPTMVRSLRGRSFRAEMGVSTADTVPEPRDPDHLVSPNPAPASMSRRGAVRSRSRAAPPSPCSACRSGSPSTRCGARRCSPPAARTSATARPTSRSTPPSPRPGSTRPSSAGPGG